MFPTVVQVVPFDDFTVDVYFEDGKIVCFDAKPLLSRNLFKTINDIAVFKKSCTVLNDTLAWDISGTRDVSSCLDIDPDTLYKLPSAKERIA